MENVECNNQKSIKLLLQHTKTFVHSVIINIRVFYDFENTIKHTEFTTIVGRTHTHTIISIIYI